MPERERHSVVHTTVGAYEGVASSYESGRPGYPPEVFSRVVAHSGVGPASKLLDLAAGTGKWTRQLLASGGCVYAVEPVEAFRKCLQQLPVTVLAGTAEAIPLPDHSINLVTVASAFHWFDAPRALAEIARVLQPGGNLAIIWNERDGRDATQRAITGLIEPYRKDEPRQADEAWLGAFEAATSFAPLKHEQVVHIHPFTADSLVERVSSISFIAAVPSQERDPLLAKVRMLTADLPSSFGLPHITHLYLTHRG